MKKYLLLITMLVCVSIVFAACSSSSNSKPIGNDGVNTSSSISSEATEDDGKAPLGISSESLNENASSQTSVPDQATQAIGTGKYPDGSAPTFSGVKLKLTVNGTEEVVIAMYDNTAVDAFLERLPMTDLSFYDLSGIEKPAQTPEEPLSIGEEQPGYDPITGEMVIYRPWGNFTIFYGDFRHSDELVPLGIVETGLEVISGQTEDFSGVLEVMES